MYKSYALIALVGVAAAAAGDAAKEMQKTCAADVAKFCEEAAKDDKKADADATGVASCTDETSQALLCVELTAAAGLVEAADLAGTG